MSGFRWVVRAPGGAAAPAFSQAARPGRLRRRPVAAATPTTPGWHEEQTLNHDGVNRYFRYLVPTGLAARPAVVILLHGGTQSMREIFGRNAGGTQQWARVAAEERFLLLVPNGVNPATGDAGGDAQSWNDCRVDAGPADSKADDVGFILALVDWADATFAIDRSRVYASGASNGGMMSYRLAMEAAGTFAAVAAFIANLPADGECGLPSRPIPVMICNGTADPLMPWNGGGVAGGRRGEVLSAAETLAGWLAVNQAGPDPSETRAFPDVDPDDGSTVRGARYRPAPGGAEVVFYTVEGGGHAMPSRADPVPAWALALLGLGTQNRDIEGARHAWEFLSRHSLSVPAAAPSE